MEVSLFSIYLVLSVLIVVIALITCGFMYLTLVAVSSNIKESDEDSSVLLLEATENEAGAGTCRFKLKTKTGIFSVYRSQTLNSEIVFLRSKKNHHNLVRMKTMLFD